jgi:hypothetical protein
MLTRASQAQGGLPSPQRETRGAKTPGKENCRYHLLNHCELTDHKSDCRLIDLGNVFSLPFTLISQVAKERGDRIRLNPPYREHMSQAFARFFMRVGLPVDIRPFV